MFVPSIPGFQSVSQSCLTLISNLNPLASRFSLNWRDSSAAAGVISVVNRAVSALFDKSCIARAAFVALGALSLYNGYRVHHFKEKNQQLEKDKITAQSKITELLKSKSEQDEKVRALNDEVSTLLNDEVSTLKVLKEQTAQSKIAELLKSKSEQDEKVRALNDEVSTLKVLKEQLEEKRHTAESDLIFKNAEMDELNDKVKGLKNLMRCVEKHFEEATALIKNEYEQVQISQAKKVQELEERIQFLNTQNQELQDQSTDPSKFEELKKEHSDLTIKYSDFYTKKNREVEDLQITLYNLQKEKDWEVKDLQITLYNLQKAVQSLTKDNYLASEVNKFVCEVNIKLKSEIEELKKSNEGIEPLTAQIQDLQQKLGAAQSRIAELEGQLDELQKIKSEQLPEAWQAAKSAEVQTGAVFNGLMRMAQDIHVRMDKEQTMKRIP